MSGRRSVRSSPQFYLYALVKYFFSKKFFICGFKINRKPLLHALSYDFHIFFLGGGVPEKSLKFFSTIYKVIWEVIPSNYLDNCLVARKSDNAESLSAALEVDCLDRMASKLININSKYFI